MKLVTKVTLCALLLAACGGAFAVDVISPTVTLITYDPNTWMYVYRVECPADMSFPFGYLQIDAQVPCDGIYMMDDGTWGQTGPWTPAYDPPGTNQNWQQGVSTWEYTGGEPSKDFAYWRSSRRQEVMPGSAWVGDFVMFVPNTIPGPGWVLTKDGVVGSTHRFEYDVPCPMIPEPGSIVGLATGLLLGLGTLLRKRS